MFSYVRTKYDGMFLELHSSLVRTIYYDLLLI